MATHSIVGDRRYPALDRVLPRIGPLTPGALPEIKPSGAAAAVDLDPVGYPDRDALIDIAGQRTASPPPPHQCIADFVEPRIADRTIFEGRRPLSILERLASDIIPTLDENEEFRSLAGSIIADEIERHRQLASWIHGGIVA
jgi:hypothetical protein